MNRLTAYVITAAILLCIAATQRPTPTPPVHAKAEIHSAVSRTSLPSRGGSGVGPRKPTENASLALYLDDGWETARGSSFGGPDEYQPVAYSTLNTRVLIGDVVVDGKRGIIVNGKFIQTDIYFVAMRRPDLARRWILLRYKGQVKGAFVFDWGPAEHTRHDIDLSQNLADALGYVTDDPIEWSLTDKAAPPLPKETP